MSEPASATGSPRRTPASIAPDHLGDKLFGIAQAIRGRLLQALLYEMANCEVVWANCHRRRTAIRGGFLRAVVAQR
jgi:hypothetical protein